MKAGDKVMIYEDPLTEKKPEGKAVLRKLEKQDSVFEHWFVKFPGETAQYMRKIKKEAA